MKKGMVYDLFISYAHLDNRPLSEGQKGWISSFHKSLEVRLGQLLGRFIDCTFKESDFIMSNFMAAEFESCAAIEGNDFTGAGFCDSNFNIEVHKNNCYFGAGVPAAETSKLPRLMMDQGHGDTIRTMAISKCGRFVASGSDDKTVKLWDMERSCLIKTFAGHNRPVL